MNVAERGRAPGVYIRHLEAPPPYGLPPLEVAAFLGFAERGPVDVPVLVEDPADLERHFGRDMELVLGPRGPGGEVGSENRSLRPYLVRAVQAFFENGGRRCWVVRVAGPEATRATVAMDFDVEDEEAATSPPVSPPEPVCLIREDTGEALVVRASSAGAWADDMRLRARLRAVALRRTEVELGADGVSFSIGMADRWRSGDLLRLNAEHLFLVEDVRSGEDDDGDAWRTASGRFLGASSPPVATSPGTAPDRIELLTLELEFFAREGSGEVPPDRLTGMGFAPAHPRYLLDVLREESVYLDPPAPTRAELLVSAEPEAPVLVPKNVPSVAWSAAVAPVTGGDDDLQSLSADLFAPPQLDSLGRAGLLDLATRAQEEAYRASLGGYVADPLRLRGLLSIVPVGEVAMVAVPDALHVTPPQTELEDLALEPPAEPDEPEQAPVDFKPCDPCLSPPTSPPVSPPASGAESLHLPERLRPAYLTMDDAARIQRAVVRLCELRGDMVAVLSVPFGSDAPEWRWGVLGRERNGSYAAFYHPWVRVGMGVERVSAGSRLIPPEGAVCGAIARRERARGVWVAPANEPLRGVLGLGERISRADWASLLDEDINVVRPFPDDFRLMSARTLSSDRHLSQLNVRRLLIALEKALLDWGMDFVFEVHSHQLRSAVRQRIERVLEELFRLGAFSGATPEESFQVIVDDTVNPRTQVDEGMLVALVKVAPSWPMEFLEVRLIRTGEGSLQMVEA